MTSNFTKAALASLVTVAVIWAAARAGAGIGQGAKGPGNPAPQAKKQEKQPPPKTAGGGGPGAPAGEKAPAEKGATEKGTAEKGTADKGTTEKETPEKGATGTTPATAPPITLKPECLDFGKQLVGSQSVVQTITVTAGPASIKVVSVKASGDFSADAGACDSQLGAGAACALTVRFAPKQAGVTNASITITTLPDTGSRIIALTGEGTASCPTTGPKFPTEDWFTSKISLLTVVLGFLLVLMLVRWNMVAVPTRRWAMVAIESVRARVNSLPDPSLSDPTRPGFAPINTLLSNASNVVTGQNQRLRDTLADYLFWNRGQEIAAWGYVHEAEEQLVSFLPADSVRAALERAESDLRQADTPAAVALADRIHEALVAKPAIPEDKCKEVVKQAAILLKLSAVNFSDRICQMLDSSSSATVADYKTLLEDVAKALEPTAATRLADQIDEALKAANPSVAALTPLLQQASKLLDPRAAAALAAKINTTLQAPPATADLWKPILEEICAYFKPPTAALAESIRQALATEPIGRWKALLYEALGFLYDRVDTKFSTLLSWHNKTIYLVGCGLLLIVSLGTLLEHGALFLLGATGGLLSRLTRTLFREDVPTDYGASWTTLFLSPVVGALMGWAGILVVILGTEFNILGSALKVDWCNPYSPVALGLAFLLGFSERFFNGIMSQLQDKILAETQAKTGQAQDVNIITGKTLASAKVNAAYSQAVAASGGTPPYKWTLSAGKLPDGLTLDPTGKITGTPTASGTFTFTLQVSDAGSKSKSQEFTIVVSQ